MKFSSSVIAKNLLTDGREFDRTARRIQLQRLAHNRAARKNKKRCVSLPKIRQEMRADMKATLRS